MLRRGAPRPVDRLRAAREPQVAAEVVSGAVLLLDEGELLRARYPDILPGFYSDKRTWISCLLDGELPEEVLRDLCGRSYALAVEKLPKYVRRELAEQPAES